jgi:hypothetical protein
MLPRPSDILKVVCGHVDSDARHHAPDSAALGSPAAGLRGPCQPWPGVDPALRTGGLGVWQLPAEPRPSATHVYMYASQRRDAPSVPNCKFKFAKLKLQLTSAATESRCHRLGARQDNPDKTT